MAGPNACMSFFIYEWLVSWLQVVTRLPEVSISWQLHASMQANGRAATQDVQEVSVQLRREGGMRGQQNRPPRALAPLFVKVAPHLQSGSVPASALLGQVCYVDKVEVHSWAHTHCIEMHTRCIVLFQQLVHAVHQGSVSSHWIQAKPTVTLLQLLERSPHVAQADLELVMPAL